MDVEEEDLLASPTSTTDVENYSKPFTREKCSYQEKCQQFRDARAQDKNYGQQYSHIYYTRLQNMKKMVEKKAREKWGSDCECKRLSQLSEAKGQECVLVGTVFKQMDLKPSILKEISSKNHLAPPPPRSCYVSSSDKLILEDEMQRVLLKWDKDDVGEAKQEVGGDKEETRRLEEETWRLEEELVTGVVVGVLGKERDKGEFLVKDVCFAGPPPPIAEEEDEMEEEEKEEEEERYVLLVSGLNLGSSHSDQFSIETMVDYITGQLGGAKDNKLCSSIVRVVMAGNSVTDKPVKSSSLTKRTQSRFLTRNYSADCLEAVKELDDLLCQLSSCVPVDLMPGSHDPTNFQLPQQPMHPCMFPKARQQQQLKGVTNPYSAMIGGRSFVGTSGENVSDIRRFTVVSDSLHILENTLRWSHLVPTAPDTLACYPYTDVEPFILRSCPHVYFAGNQPKFQSKAISVDGQSVLLVCLPEFNRSHSCVLVSLGSLSCREIKFDTTMDTTTASRSGEEGMAGQEGDSSDLQAPVEEEEMSILNHMDDEDDFDD